jgi:GNAT superfamily N-acetyltransferase
MIRAVEASADYELCAQIYAEVEPDDGVTADQLQTASGTLLLSGDGGYAYVTRSSVHDSALAMVRVRPSARRQGIGSALLSAAAEAALGLGRHRLWGRVHEDDPASRRFVAERGFREVTRDVEIVLDVAPGDGEWAPGIVELTPEHLAGAYQVAAEAIPETALPQVAQARPFDEWVKEEERQGAMAAVAIEDGLVVGYARLYHVPGVEGRLENGLTAVLRSHRRRGLATALKRAQIAWAAEHGFREIVSEMVEGNAAMRGVNRRLGYRELPAKLVVEGWPS